MSNHQKFIDASFVEVLHQRDPEKSRIIARVEHVFGWMGNPLGA
jgi:hypothetical protein